LQAIIRRDGQVLLLQRNGKWTVPGGRFNEGESSFEEALRREVLEETGIKDLTAGKISHVALSDDLSTVLLHMIAETSTQDVLISHEHDAFKWVKFSELKDYKYEHPTLKEIILSAIS